MDVWLCSHFSPDIEGTEEIDPDTEAEDSCDVEGESIIDSTIVSGETGLRETESIDQNLITGKFILRAGLCI